MRYGSPVEALLLHGEPGAPAALGVGSAPGSVAGVRLAGSGQVLSARRVVVRCRGQRPWKPRCCSSCPPPPRHPPPARALKLWPET